MAYNTHSVAGVSVVIADLRKRIKVFDKDNYNEDVTISNVGEYQIEVIVNVRSNKVQNHTLDAGKTITIKGKELGLNNLEILYKGPAGKSTGVICWPIPDPQEIG